MSWCLRETEFGHLHPTPSMLRVTAASSAMIGEMTAAKKKSVWQSVRHYSTRGGPPGCNCVGGAWGRTDAGEHGDEVHDAALERYEAPEGKGADEAGEGARDRAAVVRVPPA